MTSLAVRLMQIDPHRLLMSGLFIGATGRRKRISKNWHMER